MGAGVYYGNAARSQAANAMIALHDHISGTWPSLCPMGVGAPQRPVGKSEDVTKGAATTTTSDGSDVSVTLEPVDPWYGAPNTTITKAATVDGGGGAVTPDLVKAAVIEAVAEATKELREQLDEMSKMADPREAAYRGPGLVTKSMTAAPDGTEMESQSVIQKAASQRNEALFGYLQSRSTYAPTPAEREQARVALQQMYQNNG
jgi:hypothetical protein